MFFLTISFVTIHQILLWELGKALHLIHQDTQLGNLSTALLFGFSPTAVSSFHSSIMMMMFIVITIRTKFSSKRFFAYIFWPLSSPLTTGLVT